MVTVIAMLVGILIPGLTHSRVLAKQTACLTGLQQLGRAISAYAMENRGYIPYGPKAPPPSATNFYPQTGNVTSLISLESGAPVGLGLLLNDPMFTAKDMLWCPGADNPWDTNTALEMVGQSKEVCDAILLSPKCQTEGSYYYRHASVSSLSGTLPAPQVSLDRLGRNRKGAPIHCLAFDTQFLTTSFLSEMFNVKQRTHHKQLFVDAIYADGHASSHKNTNGRFTVNISMSVYNTLDRILDLFETLDLEQ
ncbi:MAG: hypothetical protein HY287_01930 [Planctomycetes bacterium]|nr:hypothetical protein [Planctomycetota bacterium]MBI3833069.1 hypothetical protein [Planctomycetota bacterium]